MSISTRFGIVCAAMIAVVVASAGCSSSSSNGGEQRKAEVTPPPPVNDLYNRVGEQKLRAVVNDTVDMSAKDPKVALDRAGKAAGWSATPQNVKEFKDKLFQFVAAATGGPQIYKGEDMVTAHKGMNITGEQFEAMMAHLKAAMDKHGVAADAQRDLMQVFNGTRGAIVQQQQQGEQRP